jgi:transposase
VLTEQQVRLYARQVILRELGQAGQARLCAGRVAIHAASAPEVAAVAGDYLQRAGLQVVVDATEHTLPLPDAAQVAATAGEPALLACAAWLHGAWAAVEAIKQCAEVGSPAPAGPAALTAEVD